MVKIDTHKVLNVHSDTSSFLILNKFDVQNLFGCFISIKSRFCRTLVDHRTRKAHRYIIRDRDLLRYLSGLLAFMFCYLSAWAAFSGQLAMEGHSILDKGRTSVGLTFSVCRSFWWEYVTEAGKVTQYFSNHLNLLSEGLHSKGCFLRFVISDKLWQSP